LGKTPPEHELWKFGTPKRKKKENFFKKKKKKLWFGEGRGVAVSPLLLPIFFLLPLALRCAPLVATVAAASLLGCCYCCCTSPCLSACLPACLGLLLSSLFCLLCRCVFSLLLSSTIPTCKRVPCPEEAALAAEERKKERKKEGRTEGVGVIAVCPPTRPPVIAPELPSDYAFVPVGLVRE
jgi:hypothetical protein